MRAGGESKVDEEREVFLRDLEYTNDMALMSDSMNM